MSTPPTVFSFRVGHDQAGSRLDTLVAAEVDHCSRSFAATLIRQGQISVDGSPRKPGYTVKAGETVAGTIRPPETPAFLPEAIPLQIIYEDAELLAVNKAPGMVVHPAPGHRRGTLANALMHHCPDLAGISGSLRPGIVHRLDKDTSGVLVVAKTHRAMQHLADQFKSRRVRKLYLSLVYGTPHADRGSVDLPIGRHPQERKKISVVTHRPRTALTHWRIRERFAGACLLELDIRTGRTHQIRVHCLSMGHPVIGDPVYGLRSSKKQLLRERPDLARGLQTVDRQMLHAWRLEIAHPVSGAALHLEAPLPADMQAFMDQLRKPVQVPEA